jgi:hypothetical protein
MAKITKRKPKTRAQIEGEALRIIELFRARTISEYLRERGTDAAKTNAQRQSGFRQRCRGREAIPLLLLKQAEELLAQRGYEPIRITPTAGAV